MEAAAGAASGRVAVAPVVPTAVEVAVAEKRRAVEARAIATVAADWEAAAGEAAVASEAEDAVAAATEVMLL